MVQGLTTAARAVIPTRLIPVDCGRHRDKLPIFHFNKTYCTDVGSIVNTHLPVQGTTLPKVMPFQGQTTPLIEVVA